MVHDVYPVVQEIHFLISRIGLVASILMFIIASYIGYRKRDVTQQYRRATYAIAALILLQGALGGALYAMGGRPGQEVHYVYGLGAVLALPFFIFVEVTSKKRPAMSSYIWGFFLLFAVIVRTILTGPLR
ncbi:MAG: hypothetical protein D6737_07550 [Chloroflexi bacterium]|nr:MAG: hypothetical protein CUN54_06935 [Phototrophicales bacterium]RMF80601.1 MAG: hypothetical protein D6737_07550 [Chloroflexota bacterium]